MVLGVTGKLPWLAQRLNHCLHIVLALELDLGFGPQFTLVQNVSGHLACGSGM